MSKIAFQNALTQPHSLTNGQKCISISFSHRYDPLPPLPIESRPFPAGGVSHATEQRVSKTDSKAGTLGAAEGKQLAGSGLEGLIQSTETESADSSGDRNAAEVAAKVVLELVQQSEGSEAGQDTSSDGGGDLSAEDLEQAAQAAAEDARLRAEESVKETWRNVAALNESLLIEENSRIFMPRESRFEGLEQDPSK